MYIYIYICIYIYIYKLIKKIKNKEYKEIQKTN